MIIFSLQGRPSFLKWKAIPRRFLGLAYTLVWTPEHRLNTYSLLLFRVINFFKNRKIWYLAFILLKSSHKSYLMQKTAKNAAFALDKAGHALYNIFRDSYDDGVSMPFFVAERTQRRGLLCRNSEVASFEI
ncbi:MAG: hypothetical protein VB100_04170 [Angelakisella sp.]|nr:hypothetical protein [Angelakisella sp.]